MLFVDAGNNFVGINQDTPETVLHVKSTSAGAMTTFESSSANSSGGPNIRLWRNSASPADGDGLSRLIFQGMNSAAERIDYVEIQTEIEDATDGTEDGLFKIETAVTGTSRNRLLINGTESAFNDGGRNLDFRVESDSNTHMLFVDAGSNKVGVGVGSPQQALDVNGYIKSTPNTADTNYSMELGARYDSAFPFSMAVKNNGTQFNVMEVRANSGGGSERLVFPTGNVSVGDQAAPSAKLTVSGDNNGAITLLQLRNSDTTYSQSFDFVLDTGKNMTVTGASGNGGYRFNGGTNGFVINETSNDMDFRVESDTNTHALFVDAGNSRVGINNTGPSFQLQVGATNTANMGVGWMRMETFAVDIDGSNTRWYKVANYQAGSVILQGQLFMSAARNGGANQTNGARTQHGSLAGYNNGVNTDDWGDLGTSEGHSAYYIEVGTDNHVYLRVNSSIYGGSVYCYFQGRANWAFDGTYVTSAP
jgi:hypothetical protein